MTSSVTARFHSRWALQQYFFSPFSCGRKTEVKVLRGINTSVSSSNTVTVGDVCTTIWHIILIYYGHGGERERERERERKKKRESGLVAWDKARSEVGLMEWMSVKSRGLFVFVKDEK